MKAKRISVVAALAILLIVAGVACSRAKNDAQIIGEVVTRINADGQVSNKQVSVNSSNGVVTLSGSAASDAERAAIANDAAQVEGVKTVVNNLLVAGVPVMTQQAAQQEQQPEPAPTPAPVARARKPAAYRERHVAPAAAQQTATMYALPPASNSPAVYTPPPAPLPVASVPAPPPPPQPVTIDSGTMLSVRMVDTIDSSRNQPGDIFHATLDAPVTVNDKVVIPEGADLTGHVVAAKDAGHFAGRPEIALELTSLSVNGRKYSIHTNQYSRQGTSRGASTAKTVGTGAGIGAIIGAIAGGGKGAAIGAAAGAGMGGGVQATRKPPTVHIPTEALLSFQLESPITMTPVSSSDRERRRFDSYSTSPSNNNDYSDNTGNNNGTYSAPPPSPNDGDRPVLKRRGPSGN